MTGSVIRFAFAARKPVDWSSLGFVGSVNEDMGAFGCIVVVLKGAVINSVEDYGGWLHPLGPARWIRAATKRWDDFLPTTATSA